MKVTIVLCLVLVAFAAVLVKAKGHKGHMPDDMPEDLKKEAEAVHDEIHSWKSENEDATWRDVPEELRQKMKDIKTKYEKETGHEWPKRGGRHHGGHSGQGRRNETTSNKTTTD